MAQPAPSWPRGLAGRRPAAVVAWQAMMGTGTNDARVAATTTTSTTMPEAADNENEEDDDDDP